MLSISLIVPTYRRRKLVVEAIQALFEQAQAPPFEVVVVVDGSEDGSQEALQSLSCPFPLKIVSQVHQGLARARNHGAEWAQGQLLLFLDDDMEAAPSMLYQHGLSHSQGADVVLGHMPNHPSSSPGFLSRDVGHWAEQRLRRLRVEGAALRLEDLLCGQMSIGRENFQLLGGFDETFTGGGSYGNEDLDFLIRARAQGLRLSFNPLAVSRQKYVVSFEENLARFYQVGQADVFLAQKHPEAGRAVLSSARRELTWLRPFRRPLTRWVLALLGRGIDNGVVSRLFYRLRDLEYWRGVRQAGGVRWPAREGSA